MADWWDVKQRWRGRWTRWRRQLQRRWEAWRLRYQAAHELRRTRMEAVKEGLIEQALATAVLDKGSAELHEALLTVLWERKQPELYARALEQVRQDQQEAEATRQERWQAQKAEQRRALEKEADQLIAEGVAKGIADERQEFEERRQRLIGQRNAARTRATDAEAWIIEHIKVLLPDGRNVLLRDAEIPRFGVHTRFVQILSLTYYTHNCLWDSLGLFCV